MFIGGSQQFKLVEKAGPPGLATSAEGSHCASYCTLNKEPPMARNGYKIFDADTHVRPDADLLEPYLTAAARAKLAQYEKYKAKNKDGAVTYLMGERSYKRRLGLAHDAAPQTNEYMSGYKRHQHGNPNPLCERDPAIRIQDMEVEGVDVNLMLPSGWFGCWTTIGDIALETAVY